MLVRCCVVVLELAIRLACLIATPCRTLLRRLYGIKHVQIFSTGRRFQTPIRSPLVASNQPTLRNKDSCCKIAYSWLHIPWTPIHMGADRWPRASPTLSYASLGQPSSHSARLSSERLPSLISDSLTGQETSQHLVIPLVFMILNQPT